MTVDLRDSPRTRRLNEPSSARGQPGARRRDNAAPTVVASFPPVLASNPYQRLLYEHLGQFGVVLYDGHTELTVRWLWRMRRTIKVVHFHWPQVYYRCRRAPRRTQQALSWLKLAAFAIRLAAARALGYRVVWTVHQVLPHERSGVRLDRAGSRVLAKSSNALIAHDDATAAAARELRDEAGKVHVIPHGSYVGVYPAGRTRAAVRTALGIDDSAFVFLSLGHIRAYKDLELVVDAFGDCGAPHAVLIVAGTPMDEAAKRAILAAAERDRRIKPLLEFVPAERVAELFQASDAAVIGRGDGGTSGSLILAMSLGLPTVASDTPAYRALLGASAAGWLYRPGDRASLAAALALAVRDPAATAKGAAALSRAAELDWGPIARRTAEVLRSG
jgi:glycosyltransferase involved in cell wall biosynthesis